MITLVIGHRGVGKTALLERVRVYAQAEGHPIEILDLDHEIERASGQTVLQLFQTQGEAHYRRLEELVLQKLCSQAPAWRATWISVGAGFEGEMPKGPRVLWLRRTTDQAGRIFLDRPDLNLGMTPLQEYASRYEIRQPRFARWATHEYWMPEGFTELSGVEAQVLGLREGAPVKGIVTAMRGDREELTRLARLGAFKIELRDDLLDPEQLRFAFDHLNAEQILYSVRATSRDLKGLEKVWVDWAMELPEPPPSSVRIVSRHSRTSRFQDCLQDWPVLDGAIQKLAVEVRDWQELEEGHRWWQEAPQSRAFLPRSIDGRWTWYRELMGRKMPLAFWREGSGSALDQPTLSQWLRSDLNWTHFAAVLGFPVQHSWTPAEHASYFLGKNMPVVAIPMRLNEWTLHTLEFLQSLGLAAAAVTAPLKLKSFELMSECTSDAKRFQAVNTLVRTAKGWKGHNTDVEGFRVLCELAQITTQRPLVWGGGGTREMMRAVLPEANFYSLREGKLLNQELSASELRPTTLVWATGRENVKWPPEGVRPELVVDLNYTSDSPGLEFAKKIKAKYLDGTMMFRVQAREQRKFWDLELFK